MRDQMTATAYPLNWPQKFPRAKSPEHTAGWPPCAGSDAAMAELNRARDEALGAARQFKAKGD